MGDLADELQLGHDRPDRRGLLGVPQAAEALGLPFEVLNSSRSADGASREMSRFMVSPLGGW